VNTDRFSFKKVFPHTGETFSASSAAEKWLREKGFTLGTMCSPEPRGIMKGQDDIVPKWHYLAHDKLDGMATSDNWREGDVTVHLNEDPG
jgi:hypothetical protein